jgi:uracil-DNA glycosylase
MADDLKVELASLIAAARQHVEIEASLGSTGVPVAQLAPQPASVGLPPEPAPPPRAAPVLAARSAEGMPSAPAMGGLSPESHADKRARLQVLAEEAAVCQACVLHETRTQAVFARGNPDAELAFVGEGPGQEEDRQGFPFVGPAGQLLDRMIVAMGYDRDEVYVCNVVKCRPPENRTPRPEEAIACARFLLPQLELVAPKVIVALGRCAAENLGVAPPEGGRWRGRWGEWHGLPVMPTYHPAYLLRSPEQKRVVWEDLQLVMGRLGRTPPPRARKG